MTPPHGIITQLAAGTLFNRSAQPASVLLTSDMLRLACLLAWVICTKLPLSPATRLSSLEVQRWRHRLALATVAWARIQSRGQPEKSVVISILAPCRKGRRSAASVPVADYAKRGHPTPLGRVHPGRTQTLLEVLGCLFICACSCVFSAYCADGSPCFRPALGTFPPSSMLNVATSWLGAAMH